MTKSTIGELAGNIWHLLAERNTLSIRKIGEITSLHESHIFMALGWLARENKIKFEQQQNMVYVKLVY